MKKAFKELFKDWKTWFVLGYGILCFVISLREKDWMEAMWCFLATAMYLVCGFQNIAVQAASEHIEKQENAIMEAGVIMATQAAIIKELNDKLDEQTKSNENGVRDTELEEGVERSEKNMG